MHTVWACCSCGHDTLEDRLYGGVCPDCAHSRCDSCAIHEIGSIDPDTSQYLLPPSGVKSLSDVGISHDHGRAPMAKSEPSTMKRMRQAVNEAWHNVPKNTTSNIKDSENVISDHSTTQPQQQQNSEYSTSAELFSTADQITLTTLEDSGPFTCPLDSTRDSQLINKWNSSVLPTMLSHKMNWKFSSSLRSLNITRRGSSLEESLPTIIVTCANTTDNRSVQRMLRAVSSLFEAAERSTLRIAFVEATLRRSTDPKEPPICKPRNIEGRLFPDLGSSIGIRGLTDSSATLGGYLVIDGDTFLLTVDHLLPDDQQDSESIYITHPSQQEQLIYRPRYNVGERIRDLDTCCVSCSILGKAANSNYKHEILDMEELYNPIYHKCIVAQIYQRAYQEFARSLSKPLGRLQARSGLRSRLNVAGRYKHEVEMDWALFYVDEWPVPINSYARVISNGLSFSEIVPEAQVYATGRTSGRQIGAINPAQVLINHGGRMTIEWSISPDPGTSLKDWVIGGIGVDGDSGSWVIDRKNQRVYGMVWGRHGPLADPITLFTPINHIIADIRERTGVKDICLPSHSQENMLSKKGKGKEVILPTVLSVQSDSQSDYDEKAPISAVAMAIEGPHMRATGSFFNVS
ncbi:hypothetical protein VTL71DRAFT_13521 [Oculimacula yallundae]|uniref:Uncharacterized protein n=1 Tax=Oculimacula yallundae TaxID=86028 RepID=A0ABR4CL24_9HELO